MTPAEIKAHFANLNSWQQGDERAPHKPLLVLYALGLEAAHIKWHQAGGPDREHNGLALCTLHHKTFDRGAFTVSDDRAIRVSQRAYGTHGFDEWLMRFHGERVREPINREYVPKGEFLAWHGREVFRGPARE